MKVKKKFKKAVAENKSEEVEDNLAMPSEEAHEETKSAMASPTEIKRNKEAEYRRY